MWALEKDNHHADNPPAFLGRHESNIHGEYPIDYFAHLFPESLLEEVVFQTNLYSEQQGKENLQVTLQELKIFLGIYIVMTYIRYPRIRHYWSSETGLRMDVVADAMSINRFEDLRRYLHFHDNVNAPDENDDRLLKFRPVIETTNETFRNAVEPKESQYIDEMMIPFKGRSSLQQYIPSKPKCWGYKTWVRAGASG